MRRLFRITSHLLLFPALVSLPVSLLSQDHLKTWQEKLEFLKNDPQVREKGDMIYLKLLDYNYKGVISSESHKSRILDSLFFKDAPFIINLPPIEITDTLIKSDTCLSIQKKSFPRFRVVTVSKMEVIMSSIGEIYPFEQTKSELGELIECGFGYVEILWDYKGDKFTSICFVSNDHGGVIYDPLLNDIGVTTQITSESIRYLE